MAQDRPQGGANQNEAEYFAVVATGRKGLDEMAAKMTPEIMAIAARSVAEAGEAWMKRAIVSIASNEALADVIKTRTGLFSIYKGLARAATMGLQLGGQFPHAHFVPYKGVAELITTADGYKHAAVHGPGAILSNIEVKRVYEGEEVRLDVGAGRVDHIIKPGAARGKLIGVYGKMTRTDGTSEIDYMSKEEALRIRDTHSAQFRGTGKGPWKDDEDAMIEKTATKKFLRRYAAEAEGLGMLYSADADDGDYAPAPPPRDVTERMAGHLEERTERIVAAEAPQTEEKPAPAEKPAPSAAPAELF